MDLSDKTEKRIIGASKKEVTVVIKPLTGEEAREMFPYRPSSKYSESRFGHDSPIFDDFAALLNDKAKRCITCQAPTRLEYIKDNQCPDCDGRSEYNGKNPREPVNQTTR
jgi:hypothetical protein